MIEGDACYLIDSGMDGSEKAVFSYMEETGQRPEEIKGIFLTHAPREGIRTALRISRPLGIQLFAKLITGVGIQSVVDKIHEKLPSTRILLLNILPNDIRDWHVRGAQDPKEKWLKDREINKQINAFYANSSFVTCLNLEKVFLNKDGSINETLYYDPQEVNFLVRKCGPLHPSTAGHILMAEAIKPVLKKLMEKPALSPEQ